VFAEPLIRFMAQDTELIAQTVTYIRLETIANIFSTLLKFATVILVTIKKEKYLYGILAAQMALTICFDTFLISNLSVSAKLGVNGIAITNIIVNALLFCAALFMLKREDIRIFVKEKLSFSWAKSWAKVGGISGFESFVRNLAFMLMIVRMCNVVGEQGTFWVANNFIWGWLILPITQLGELIKRDVGADGREAIRKKSLGYFTLTTGFVLLWFILMPLYTPFMNNVLQLADTAKIMHIVLISIGFYVLYAFNNVIDSTFYGMGRTDLMLYQSLAVNIIFYGGAFILYITGIYVPTLTSIALMFALGTGVDSVLTFGIYKFMLKKHGLSIKN
jgi:Na+-driven multidrug efflux pump